jgi:basic membrane protein A
MFSKRAALVALIAAFAIIAAACSSDSDTGGICEVTDVGGVDDKGFNQSAWEGAQRAGDTFDVRSAVLESQAETDYAVNIQSFVDQDCDLIVTVGFLLGQATQDAANANPEQEFTIVDFAYGNVVDENFEEVLDDDGNPTPQIENANVKGLVFGTEQGAFLAGYLAAGMTTTGKVGTFGGINIPPVTVFMDGYVQGVDHYNSEKGTSVEVLGWNLEAQDGLFTGNFESLDDGRAFAQSLVDEGADIIMPVAGPVGLGSAALASELGTFSIIGVDTDGAVADESNSAVYLVSVLKRIDNAVFAASDASVNGNFSDALYVGTLANNGVGLSEYHDWDDRVSSELKAEIEALRTAIIDAVVSVSVGGAG